MPKRSHSNPIVFRTDANIGNISAEADDDFLFECFVDHPAVSTMADLDSAKLFISGRTGSGKTAVLRMIEKQQANVSSIDLHELALGYVANSTIIQFLDALGVDLDIFFQALWKHILCIEFIRLKFAVKNEHQSRSIFQVFSNFFKSDERKKSGVEYLRKWEGKFWITMDENIRELTQQIEETIDAELSTEINKFKSNVGYSRSLNKEKKSALVARAKKIVDAKLLVDLGRVLDMLAEYEDENHDKYASSYYILIDKIDEKWVDDSIRYQLIRALIECLRSFRKIHRLKIIVAMRSDVLERVVQESNHSGFQREKYDDYIFRLRWNKDQLKQLIDKRINFLFRKKYSSEQVFLNDIFDHKVGKIDSFTYMLDRTQMRPRDIIGFINACLENAEGKSKVTQRIIRQSESDYSRVRLQALTEEWESAFPTLRIAFQTMAKLGHNFKSTDLLSKEFVEQFILETGESFDGHSDPLCSIIRQSFNANSDVDFDRIARLLVSELYRIGAIGLKTSPSEPFQHSHINSPAINPELINDDVKIRIHPMIHRALNLP